MESVDSTLLPLTWGERILSGTFQVSCPLLLSSHRYGSPHPSLRSLSHSFFTSLPPLLFKSDELTHMESHSSIKHTGVGSKNEHPFSSAWRKRGCPASVGHCHRSRFCFEFPFSSFEFPASGTPPKNQFVGCDTLAPCGKIVSCPTRHTRPSAPNMIPAALAHEALT
jgi:hypothetical protein